MTTVVKVHRRNYTGVRLTVASGLSDAGFFADTVLRDFKFVVMMHPEKSFTSASSCMKFLLRPCPPRPTNPAGLAPPRAALTGARLWGRRRPRCRRRLGREGACGLRRRPREGDAHLPGRGRGAVAAKPRELPIRPVCERRTIVF